MNGQSTQDGNQQNGQPAKPEQTIAGRMIPLMEAFHRAFEKARGQTLGEPHLSACLPLWCHNIMDQLAKTVLKRVVALDPKGKFNSRGYGRMIGVLLRGCVFAVKEVEPILRREGLLDLTQK